jgi:hypothetical protein
VLTNLFSLHTVLVSLFSTYFFFFDLLIDWFTPVDLHSFLTLILLLSFDFSSFLPANVSNTTFVPYSQVLLLSLRVSARGSCLLSVSYHQPHARFDWSLSIDLILGQSSHADICTSFRHRKTYTRFYLDRVARYDYTSPHLLSLPPLSLTRFLLRPLQCSVVDVFFFLCAFAFPFALRVVTDSLPSLILFYIQVRLFTWINNHFQSISTYTISTSRKK